MTFGVTCTYTVIISDYFETLIVLLVPPSSILVNKFVSAAIPLLVMLLPLSLLKKLDFLSYTSFLAIGSFIYITLKVGIAFLVKLASDEGIAWSKIRLFRTDVFLILNSIPIAFFAYGCQTVLFTLYKELKNR
jgi:amino acid permease